MMYHDDPLSLRLRPAPAAVRIFEGPRATEAFIHCRPHSAVGDDITHQTESAYSQLLEILQSLGARVSDVVQETVYFRDLARDFHAFSESRRARFRGATSTPEAPFPSVFIEQPPLDARRRIEVLVAVVVPHDREVARIDDIREVFSCACGACSRVHGRAVTLDGRKQLFAGSLFGTPRTAYDEAYSMFEAAQALLENAGMDFHDVARTWIYLRDMERDYPELNRARARFFEERGITLRPASTGINGGPSALDHDLALSFYAIERRGVERSTEEPAFTPMTTPTLNEAWEYGADFSRGMRVPDANKVALYISGTASVDEHGRTVHVGDCRAQIERMLVNIAGLLEHQGATFADIVSATTYLKHPEDAGLLRAMLRERIGADFPNALVHAAVCRPDLLCEMEAIAILPLEP